MVQSKKYSAKNDLLSRIDFFMQVYKEKIPDNGEDALLYSLNTCAAIIGVFDGCGGSGAKRYSKLQNKTGAYLASRIVSGTLKDWFARRSDFSLEFANKNFENIISQNLQICQSHGAEESKLVSPIVKILPTTAAFAICTERDNSIQVDYFWAGDSRVYLLNSDGLAQLSVDDLAVPDAMENLYNTGAMTNVISKSKAFTIHHGTIFLDKPGIVFAATDGCFDYLSTPMEFEYLLLERLLESQCVADWEKNLYMVLEKIAGDDYSLSAVAFNYGNFETMRTSFIDRANQLYSNYISQISSLDRVQKTNLWGKYKNNYYRLQN